MTKQLASNVRGGLPVRTRELATGGIVRVAPALERELTFCPTPVHGDREHEVISAELVACTLGQRVRPELQVAAMDHASRLAEMLDRLRANLRAAQTSFERASANLARKMQALS